MRILLVPACEVKPVNQLEGTFTLKRLEKAMELWQTGEYEVMVITGGTFLPRSTQTRPLAVTMWEWLRVQPGAPPIEKVLIEPNSRDTYENAHFSCTAIANWLRSQGRMGLRHFRPDETDVSLTIVTEKHHGRRFLATFRSHRGIGWQNVTVVPVQYSLSVFGSALEWALLLMHIVDPAGQGFLARLNQRLRTQPGE